MIPDYLDLRHCDNMKLMAQFEENYFDLAIVDPPYGNIDAIGLTDNKKRSKQSTPRKGYKLFSNIQPGDQYYLELEKKTKEQIIWGGNYLGLCGGLIVWQKNGTAFGEAEAAVCSTHKSVKIFEYTWNGMIQGDMKNKEHRIHPTQKPVALYKWLLKNYAKEGDKILDTHLGSMSIAIAVHEMNKQGMNLTLVGCELDEDYYKAGIERVEKHCRQLDLFK